MFIVKMINKFLHYPEPLNIYLNYVSFVGNNPNLYSVMIMITITITIK